MVKKFIYRIIDYLLKNNSCKLRWSENAKRIKMSAE